MNKLLNANFYKLKKSKVFWTLLIFSIILVFIIIYNEYNSMIKYHNIIELNNLVFSYIPYFGFAISLFISIFLSDEYLTNTIRNKLIVGHSRTKIYLSNIITISIVSIIVYIIYSLLIIIIGYPIFGGFTIKISSFIFLMFKTILIIISLSSIFTFTVISLKNTTLAAIGNLFLAFIFLLSAFWSSSILSESEYTTKVVITNEDTNEFKYVEEKNPLYPKEKERKIYEFILDIVPTGQAFEIAYDINTTNNLQPLYSIGVIIIFIELGLYVFKRKELD